jgi:hypothetical protein
VPFTKQEYRSRRKGEIIEATFEIIATENYPQINFRYEAQNSKQDK